MNRALWTVQSGIFLNMVGYGAVLPFEIIYLHQGRDLSLSLAGLVIGMVNGVAVVAAPVVGPVIDRFGARVTAAGAGLALAAGYTGLAISHTAGAALVAATAAGLGNGALNPSQSALLATLAAREHRPRVTAVSRVAANLGFGLGGAIGGAVAAYGLRGYVVLLLGNAVTYVLYVMILLLAVRRHTRPESIAGGYRQMGRDSAFVRLALINIGLIAVGWGVLPWIVPPYASGVLNLGPRLIGLLLLANAATVVLAQIPVVRLAEGRRRAVAIMAAGMVFGLACLLLAAADRAGPAAYTLLLLAAIAFGLGECCYSTALMPLVADLAPPALRGRYMATISTSWWLGLALAPSAGTPLLSRSPLLALVIAAAVAVTGGTSALALEQHLPAAIRLTPRVSRRRERVSTPA